MNPATHLYKTSVLAIRTAALAAALFVTTSAPARTAHTANPKEGGGNAPAQSDPDILRYNNPGLTVDLGVGLWGIPLPVDYDGDGLKDLLVSCPDRPYKGLYFFKNIGTPRHPRFAAAERISEKGMNNIRLSEADGKPYVLSKNFEYPDFFKAPYAKKRRLHYEGEELGATYNKSRSNMWSYADWDGDGDKDIVVGIDTWDDYGWDNAFDSLGRWTRGPLHGYVYLLENTGRGYVNRGKVEAAGAPIDVYGAPNPCIADFDGDGDPDLICGEFVDGLTWFENVGTRTEPRFAAGRPLANKHGEIRLHLEMIVPVVSDFDGDGHPDLIVGDEDGRVAWVRHTGKVKKGMPQFESPLYFTQQADPVKFGALSTPCAFDWDGDGKLDLLIGSVKRSSYPSPERGLPYSRFKKKEIGLQVMLLINAGTNEKMVFKEPVQLQIDGKDFYLGAHSNAPEPCMLGDTSKGPNLVVGCESGKYFFFEHDRITTVGIDD